MGGKEERGEELREELREEGGIEREEELREEGRN